MYTSYATDPQTLGLGLLVGRLVIGLLMAAHGAQKLLGWFGGYGFEGTVGYMTSTGIPFNGIRAPEPAGK